MNKFFRSFDKEGIFETEEEKEKKNKNEYE